MATLRQAAKTVEAKCEDADGEGSPENLGGDARQRSKGNVQNRRLGEIEKAHTPMVIQGLAFAPIDRGIRIMNGDGMNVAGTDSNGDDDEEREPETPRGVLIARSGPRQTGHCTDWVRTL